MLLTDERGLDRIARSELSNRPLADDSEVLTGNPSDAVEGFEPRRSEIRSSRSWLATRDQHDLGEKRRFFPWMIADVSWKPDMDDLSEITGNHVGTKGAKFGKNVFTNRA
jgi:hypothetical protein